MMFSECTCTCHQDAKVMSWWDYGYQITAMANRTILVDNNTWNNTHISRVGQVTHAHDSINILLVFIFTTTVIGEQTFVTMFLLSESVDQERMGFSGWFAVAVAQVSAFIPVHCIDTVGRQLVKPAPFFEDRAHPGVTKKREDKN